MVKKWLNMRIWCTWSTVCWKHQKLSKTVALAYVMGAYVSRDHSHILYNGFLGHALLHQNKTYLDGILAMKNYKNTYCSVCITALLQGLIPLPTWWHKSGDVRKYIGTVPLMVVSPPSCTIDKGQCFDLYQEWLHFWVIEFISSCMMLEIGFLSEMIGWSSQCQLLHGWRTSRTSELGDGDWVTSHVIRVEVR